MNARLIFFPLVTVVVVLLAATAFALGPVSGLPDVGCISNIANPPQEQYAPLLVRLEHDPGFIRATGGLCYVFNSGFEVSGPGVSALYLVFDHETPHVIYPCNSFGVHQIDKRLEASPQTSANGTVVGFTLEFVAVPDGWFCQDYFPNPTPVELRATNDTMHSQELVSVTLKNNGLPITSLTVELLLPSGNYTEAFTSVSNSTPLGNG